MKKKVIIAASYSQDLSLILQWLRLKKVLKKRGTIIFDEKRKFYFVSIIPKVSKQKISDLVKDRFGSFGKIL